MKLAMDMTTVPTQVVTFPWSTDQWMYPNHAQEVGPPSLKTPRKYHCFGVCAEGAGKFYTL